MKKLTTFLALVLMIGIMFSACGGAKGSQGLTFLSNGDGTCAVTGIGTCTDDELVIPSKSSDGDKVVSIADSAFESTKIRSVTLANSVTEIGIKAFDNCRRLEKVDLGKSLVKMGSYAFSGCDLITEIELPSTFLEFVKSVGSDGEEYGGSGTFNGCTKLAKINIPKGVKAIYYNTFADTALTEVTVEASFPYAILDFTFGLSSPEPAEVYYPSLLAEKPVGNSISYLFEEDAIDVSDVTRGWFYALLFENENIIVNGEAVSAKLEPACTPGTYAKQGADKYDPAFSIVSNSEIDVLDWNDTRGEYEISKFYRTANEAPIEEKYNFSFDETMNTYVFESASDEETYSFLVVDKYLFVSGYGGYFELNAQGYHG